MSRALRAVLVIALAFASLALLPGSAAADDPFGIKIVQVDPSDFPNVRLVASVVDSQQRPLTGLQVSDIAVSEDGRAQRASVAEARQVLPIALALVLDTSGSMAGRPMVDAKAAISTLIQSLGPNDQAALITFSTTPTLAQGLTTDKAALVAAANAAVATGNTAIFDGLNAAIDALAPAPAQARRAVVLLTDGIDNSSRISLGAVTDRVKAQGDPVYVVGLGSNLDRPVLQALADGSKGGQAFVAPTSAQLSAIYAGLTQQILTQYVVTYRSNVPKVAAGATLALTLQIVQAGAITGSATTTFTVPPGHGIAAPPTVEPAPQPQSVVVPRGLTGPYSAEVVGLLGTAAALCLLLWAFTISTTRSLNAVQRRRVGDLLAGDAAAPDRVQGRSVWTRAVLPLLRYFTRPLGRIASESMSERTRRKLAQAGDPFDFDPAGFLGLRIGLAIVFGALFASLGAVIQYDAVYLLLIVLMGVLVGYLLPGLALDRMVKSRQRKILRALPSALDMLALSARAGMTLDGAVSQVVQRWDNPLCDELRRLLSEFRMGRDRRDALRAMAHRTGVQDVTRFANAVIQADSLGVPVSKVLLDQSLEMRTRRRQRAEEAARKAPVKMLFPMVGLIFPALFVVILGPAVPRFMALFEVVH
jgi:tight adherence protein C